MSLINIEIKASCADPASIRTILQQQGADFRGTDLQTDTYFHTSNGRLKLRQGNIENNLIYYERTDQAGPKQSDFSLLPVSDGEGLKSMLTKAIGVKVSVTKKREIYFIDNVKFHIDELEGFGNFVEIEASNKSKAASVEELYEQCNYYLRLFGIKEEDLLQRSYSDMLLER